MLVEAGLTGGVHVPDRSSRSDVLVSFGLPALPRGRTVASFLWTQALDLILLKTPYSRVVEKGRSNVALYCVCAAAPGAAAGAKRLSDDNLAAPAAKQPRVAPAPSFMERLEGVPGDASLCTLRSLMEEADSRQTQRESTIAQHQAAIAAIVAGGEREAAATAPLRALLCLTEAAEAQRLRREERETLRARAAAAAALAQEAAAAAARAQAEAEAASDSDQSGCTVACDD